MDAVTQAPGEGAGAKRPAFCGVPVSDEEWGVLCAIVSECRLSRHELARTICEALGWVRPSGRLKARECYEYLGLLEERGLLRLPARRPQRPRGPTRIGHTAGGREQPRREGRLCDVAPVVLGLVAHAEQRALWRELIDRYHYLGHKVAYGAHLRYLIWISTPRREIAGCLQFSSAARWLAARDRFIGWNDVTRQKNLPRVINNSRFLIVPWLSIRGLASHVLSLAGRVVADDWEEAYGVRPVLVETFVQRDRFEGTCYKAANWIEVGETAGRGRMDRHKRAHEPIKRCLVYPLVGDFRRRLGAPR
jgi:hypothetical protein